MKWAALVAALVAIPHLAAAQQVETIEYYGQDVVGSVRIVWNASGTVQARQDYAPFGKQLSSAQGAPKESFAGEERDGEADQSNLHARMLPVRIGRFSAPDPVQDGVIDPQRWNRYAYALNNPVAVSDSSGLDAFALDGSKCSDTGYQTEFSQFCTWWIMDQLGMLGGGPSFWQGSSGRDSGWGNVSAGTPIPVPTAPVQDVSKAPAGNQEGCAQVPLGTPSKYCGPLEDGLNVARKALQTKSCSAFFGNQGLDTLNATTYRFLDFTQADLSPDTAAQTVGRANNVQINTVGPYFNMNPQLMTQGKFNRFWSQSNLRGFILLHELGHELSPITGFQPDSGPSRLALNESQSRQVVSKCF